jgi:hypothetical protein
MGKQATSSGGRKVLRPGRLSTGVRLSRPEWDWPSSADERRRGFESEILEARVIARRPPVGFLSCVMITAVAMVVVMIFTWRAWLMLFVLVGVTSVSTMLAVLIGAVILGAAWLHTRLSGRPF